MSMYADLAQHMVIAICVLSERVADAVSGGNKNHPLSVRRLRRVHSAAYNADHRPGGCTRNMKQPLVQGGSRGVRGVASVHLSDDAFSTLKPCGACKKRKKGADPEGLHINCSAFIWPAIATLTGTRPNVTSPKTPSAHWSGPTRTFGRVTGLPARATSSGAKGRTRAAHCSTRASQRPPRLTTDKVGQLTNTVRTA
ncbi:unnamed protein product [Vitrella brassicaformis CCMP3155]|uniref:Uncharacterized protein n=1 Tax=Vitrella brassicaformis (strain CCMP3155) TaxID=1169540 RepID=A0A0G4H5X9_VITBC|nr:unnamed protein product [Vitrella brassicaformis CCMP3155]|eukprot:CEM38987.1 unnamed protein product [Vitrella brassicaformis CCMP3155]